MIHRLPTSEILRPYVKHILTLMLTLLKIDNEENVLVCLRIIIELHKQYRPEFNPEVCYIRFRTEEICLINSIFRFKISCHSSKQFIRTFRSIYQKYSSLAHRFV